MYQGEIKKRNIAKSYKRKEVLEEHYWSHPEKA